MLLFMADVDNSGPKQPLAMGQNGDGSRPDQSPKTAQNRWDKFGASSSKFIELVLIQPQIGELNTYKFIPQIGSSYNDLLLVMNTYIIIIPIINEYL